MVLALALMSPAYVTSLNLWSPTDVEPGLYYHMRAAFGPQYDTVQARVVMADPLDLCSDNPQANFTGMIAVGIRDNCTFVEKAYRAQRFGAIGVIIGNSNNAIPHLVRMGVPPGPSDAQLITIPSVFVSLYTLTYIVSVLSPVPSAPVASNLTTDRILMATISYDGEVDNGEDFNSTLRMAGWILLILPLAWCFVGVFFCCRRRCSERRTRIARFDRARNLPSVSYRPLEESEEQKRATGIASPSAAASAVPHAGEDLRLTVHSGDAPKSPIGVTPLETSAAAAPAPAVSPRKDKKATTATSPRIHNEACAICLEDFTVNQKIKLLPCSHGFHGDCIDPWLNHRSDLCPICKTSILNAPPPTRRFGCL